MTVLREFIARIVFFLALIALIGLGRFVSVIGVGPAAAAAMIGAALLSLSGALWYRPLLLVGHPLAWLAATVLFVERGIAYGFNVWLCVVALIFDNITVLL